MQSEQLSVQKIYAWGSAECDQFLAKDEDDEEIFEVKRPYLLKELNNLIIVQIACGGMHALILTSEAKVYSFGCDDKGVLGRPNVEGEDARLPALITDLPPVDMIACGSSHSVAANSQGAVYFWGFYANTHGPIGDAVQKPKKMDNITSGIKKILCGQNHTMVLLDTQKLLTWGDAETLVIGRKSETRRSIIQNLNPQPIKMKKPILDIYTGASHAFVKVQIKDNKTSIFGWGLNNYGQLGIGNQENQQLPTQIDFFDELEISDIVGGEHHTIFLDNNGNMYSCGRHDDGQLGLGEEINEELRVKAEKVREEEMQKQQNSKKKTSKKNKQQGELFEIQQSSKVIGYEFITSPQIVKDITQIQSIYASMHFNYAISNTSQIYSWGNGQSFVLGTRNENSQYKPRDITSIFKDEKLLQISLGASHVIAYTSTDKNFIIPKINPELIKLNDQQLKTKGRKPKTGQSREASKEKSLSMKKSVQKFDDSLIPVKDLKID